MGTSYEIQLLGHVPDQQELLEAIEEELAAIDREMSTWREDSDISRFNANPGDTAFPVPGRLLEVVDAAQRLSAATDGALDITLMPLALAWGFQGADMPGVPDPETLAQLRKVTGMHTIQLSVESATLSKQHPGVMLDVSALAKGYAVDQLARLLLDRGFQHFMVEIGGEVRALGERPGGGPWRIAVELPGGEEPGDEQDSRHFIELQNHAVASSGDYRNYFMLDGTRYGHVLDPTTLRPADFGAAAATVIADDTITADALATAFLAVPRERAFRLARELDVELLVVSRGADGGLEQHKSPGFNLLQLP